jgi:hypothetical protein
MQQLQHLKLSCCEGLTALDEAHMPLYAALTASTQLTRLDLAFEHHILADSAAKYMFQEGKQLPHLRTLLLGQSDWDAPNDIRFPLAFGTGDLARLAAACHALEQLCVRPCIQPAADIRELTLLTSVTELKIGGWDLRTSRLTAALQRMTQLVDLKIAKVDYLYADEVAALTRLTGLRHLVVEATDNEQLLEDYDVISLHSRVGVVGRKQRHIEQVYFKLFQRFI